LFSSGEGAALCSKADAIVDFPVDGWPRRRICFVGREREEETESRIEDQRFSGGASGVDEREFSIAFSSNLSRAD